MAKSTGNLVLVRDLLAQHSAAAVRLLLLDRRWSEPWTYEVSMLDEAADRLERLRVSAGRRGSEAGRDEVIAALLADLDVPRALDVAEESGGPAARAALDLLKL
jgi:cysteinyl-tRNA synthetase